MSYQFTQDWFKAAPHVWPKIKDMMPRRESFLEIGSYEGRSSVWTVEHMLDDNGSITCVDTWIGSEEHAQDDMAGVEARFDHNTNVTRERFPMREIYKVKKTSVAAMAEFMTGGYVFDFIYIDGSHCAKDVMTDSCMAWKLLRTGGFLVWDDYLWGNPRDILHNPKLAIDSFIMMFGEELQIISMGYQIIVQRRQHA